MMIPGKNTASLLILLIIFFTGLNVSAQNCLSTNSTFKSGETVTYIIAYDWFVIWTDVGEVTVSITDTTYNGIPVYKFEGIGVTYKSWNKILRVKDEFVSLVDKTTLKPYMSYRIVRENNYRKYDSYRFDYKKSLAYASWSKDNIKFKTDTLPVNSCTFDIMSALLYARNIDFSKYQVGEAIPFTVLLDNESFPIYFRYLGKEDIKMKHVGTFDCIKFRIMLVAGDMFKEGDHATIWVTNDKNRIVVFAESPIKVGSVKARIRKIRNNRYPVTSLEKIKK
jgi:hypothetical protein